MNNDHLDGVRFALAGGITWGIGLALATMIAYLSGYGADSLEIFKFYPGYDVSVVGIGIGFIWGFIHGFVMAGFFAWIYNHIHRRHEHK